MPRKKAKALPPKMITVYGEILNETEEAILVRCDKEADGVWLPKSQIKYDGERYDTGVKIDIPDWLANEKGFFDGQGFKPEEPPASVAEQEPATPSDTETVTVSGKVIGITEEDITIEFPDSEGALVEYELPRSVVSYEGNLQPGDEAAFTIPLHESGNLRHPKAG